MARWLSLSASLLGFLLLTASPVPAHEGEKLGTVHFETSCSAAAQPALDRAVALLHSFWFQMALGAFDEVAKIDPTCGMAYWGKAMTWWGNPLARPPVARGLTALHMPSHIVTRVGAWEESIESNRASAKAAMSELGAAQGGYASYNALHAMDYMTYAYLQLGRDRETRAVVEEVGAIRKLDIDNFAAAFAFAAIPARYTLERGRFANATALTLHPADLGWQRFPQAESVHWFARGLGAARSGNSAGAREALARLEALRDAMVAAKSGYWAEQAEIQRRGVEAWLAQAEGRPTQAVALMRAAAELEDAREKHPVTPGAIKPARELLGEMLLAQGQSAAALAEFEASQKIDPNRLAALYGAARAAESAGDAAKARRYYDRVAELGQKADADRPEVAAARAYLKK